MVGWRSAGRRGAISWILGGCFSPSVLAPSWSTALLAWPLACFRTRLCWRSACRRRMQARSSTLPKFSPPAPRRPPTFTTATSTGALMARLGITGVLGAILGAWVLSNIEVGAARRFVYIYLLIMGIYILWKSLRIVLAPRPPAGWTLVLGFGAGFLDATGGGGWGPMTTSTLVGSGHAPRYSVGSVNTAEFFVTVAAATTFLRSSAPCRSTTSFRSSLAACWRRHSAAGSSSTCRRVA